MLTADKKIGGRILLIEDDLDVRKILRVILHPFINCEILEAANGIEGLNILSLRAIDLVICDIRMPLMNGKDFFKKFRERDQHTPVIFLTGFNDSKLEQELLKMGAFDFLEKPCASNDLIILVEEAITSSRNKKPNTKNIESQSNDASLVSLPNMLVHHCRIFSVTLVQSNIINLRSLLQNCLENAKFILHVAQSLQLTNLEQFAARCLNIFENALQSGRISKYKIQTIRETFLSIANQIEAHPNDRQAWDRLPEWNEINRLLALEEKISA